MGQFLDEQPAGGRGKFLDEPADTRTSFRRWYDSIAQPVTRTVASGAKAYELSQRGGPATREEYAPGPEAMEAAKLVVPQSPIAAGAMIGTGVMGGAAAGMGARGGWAALSRILGGTVGGELGDISEGGSGAKGAALGGIPAAIGEGAVGLGSKVMRSLPWIKGVIEGKRAANIGQALGDVAEPLAGAKTTQDVYRLAAGEGQEKLGAAKEKAVQQIEDALKGRMYGPGPGEIPAPRVLRGETTYGPNQPLPVGRVVDVATPPSSRPSVFPSERPIDVATPPSSAPGRGAEPAPGQEVADVMRTLGGERTPAPRTATVSMYGASAPVPASPPGASNSAETAAETMARLGGRTVGRSLGPYEGTGIMPPSPGPPSRSAETFPETIARLGGQPTTRPIGQYEAAGGPTREALSTARTSMSLREANAALSEIGDMMAGRKPLDPRFKDADLGAVYRSLAADIRAGIEESGGPGAAKLWDVMQAMYRRGRAALQPFEQAGAFKGSTDSLAWGSGSPADAGRMIADQRGGTAAIVGAAPKTLLPNLTSRYSSGPMDGLQLNAPGIQRWLVAPENRAEIVRKLGPDGYDRLVRGVWFDKPPFSAPESMKTIIDMALERGADGLSR